MAAVVHRCRRRLQAAGIDPGRFTAADAAGDVFLLAQSLGVRKWIVDAHGNASLIALDYARSHPSQVVALVLDSPELSDHGPDALGPGLDAALAATARACAREPRCARAYGDLRTSWHRALARLRIAPLLRRKPERPASPSTPLRCGGWSARAGGRGTGAVGGPGADRGDGVRKGRTDPHRARGAPGRGPAVLRRLPTQVPSHAGGGAR